MSRLPAPKLSFLSRAQVLQIANWNGRSTWITARKCSITTHHGVIRLVSDSHEENFRDLRRTSV